MANHKEARKKLTEAMTQIDVKITHSNSELKELKAILSSLGTGSSNLAVTVSVHGFDEGSTLTASVSPESICAAGSKSSSSVASGKPALFIVRTLEGSLTVNSGDSDLGSWPLSTCSNGPIEEDISMGTCEGFENVLKLKVKAARVGELREDVSEKSREITELDLERKKINKELGELRSKVKPTVHTKVAGTPGGGQTHAMEPKRSVFHMILAGPAAFFRIGAMIYNSPLKEVAFFCGGVGILMFKGDDLAV